MVIYQPQTLRESWTQLQLLAADRKARKSIEQARDVFSAATSRHRAAAGAFYAKELRPGVVRPTQEQLEALRREAEAKWLSFKDFMIRQVDRYEDFLVRYPQNWYVRHRYAWFLADHTLGYEAAEEWRKVIKLAPDFPYAYNNLASLYNHMGRDLEAVDLFRKAIALKDDDATFHVNLAVNYSTHRFEVAEKFGWDLPRVFRECVAEYRKARELIPAEVEVARELASQYVLAKHFGVEDAADEAIEAWQYYLALDLTRIQRGIGCRNVGSIYLKKKKDPAAALEWLKKAVELLNDPSSRTMLQQAVAALQDESRSQ